MSDTVNIDWQKLGFKFFPTKYMFVATCNLGEEWKISGLKPFGNIEMSPAAGVLNYGQGLFEGLKAYSGKNGNTYLFRPEKNAERIQDGCKRLCVPPLPKEIFLEAVFSVAKANREYIPPFQENSMAQGALYLRPIIWGTGPILGVSPAPSYTFVTYASPVGPYFSSGFQAIKLQISKEHHRAAIGGTGGIKAIGNYCVGMKPAQMAKENGFQEVLYLDAKNDEFIEEVGAANFFCVKNGELFTPSLDGCILPGITRNSVIELAKNVFNMKVHEEKVPLKKVLDCDEAFASGTGAVITPIGFVNYDDKDTIINKGVPGPITTKIYKKLLNIQHGVADNYLNWRSEIIMT